MLKNQLIKNFYLQARLQSLEKKKVLYKNTVSPQEIYQFQLNKFNGQWQKIIKSNSFYKMWAKKHHLPEKVKDIDELKRFPALTKKDIKDHKALIFDSLKNYWKASTGGTTGEIVEFPTNKKEKHDEYTNTYLGKYWWDIYPLDEILMFWGHSHLFGQGVSKVVNQLKRNLADWCINTRRLNAYDMTTTTIREYCSRFKAMNPTAVIGYTSCIYKLAKTIYEQRLNIGNKTSLKGIILTAEMVTHTDVDLMRTVFNVPIIIEYGMVEAGVIAYSQNETFNIEIFWDSFIATAKGNDLLITTLNEKLFPLINYQTNDQVTVKNVYNNSILSVSAILGRTKDVLKVGTRNNKVVELSGILIVHILKNCPHVYSVGFEQLADQKIKVKLVSPITMDIQKVRDHFFKKIIIDCPDINVENIIFVQVDELKRNIAGKEIISG